jgi:hypothetical protein
MFFTGQITVVNGIPQPIYAHATIPPSVSVSIPASIPVPVPKYIHHHPQMIIHHDPQPQYHQVGSYAQRDIVLINGRPFLREETGQLVMRSQPQYSDVRRMY